MTRQPVISWDESVYLAEQQCYTPVADPTGNLKTKTGEKVTDTITLRFNGELADVAHYLAMIPEEPKRNQRKAAKHAAHSDTPEADPTTSEHWALWEGIDQHTMDDLRSALFSPGMIKISEGPRNPGRQLSPVFVISKISLSKMQLTNWRWNGQRLAALRPIWLFSLKRGKPPAQT